MDFNTCASHLADSASTALGVVISKFRSFRNIGFSTFSKLFDAMVVPVMDYGSAIWGFKDFPQCNRIQNRAMCYYLGVHSRAPIAGMQGDIAWFLPKYRRYINMLRLWNRFISLSDDRLTKQIFIWEHVLNQDNNGSSWTNEVRYILQLINLQDLFSTRSPIDLHVARNHLKIIMEKEWQSNVLSKPKLRSYFTI